MEKVEKPAKKAKIAKPGQEKAESGCTLIITEKPQAAAKIAAALGDAEKKSVNGVDYYEIQKPGKKILIGCAVGHLFTLVQTEKKREYPVFNIGWKPNFQVKKHDWSKKYYSALLGLCKKADEFVIATDYDVEGEVIGWNVLRFICGKETDKKARRMKFSSLTKGELEKSWENLSESINWGHAVSGETRHYLDWFYGINLSRALMRALSETGKF